MIYQDNITHRFYICRWSPHPELKTEGAQSQCYTAFNFCVRCSTTRSGAEMCLFTAKDDMAKAETVDIYGEGTTTRSETQIQIRDVGGGRQPVASVGGAPT
jgi:hypothetical protein